MIELTERSEFTETPANSLPQIENKCREEKSLPFMQAALTEILPLIRRIVKGKMTSAQEADMADTVQRTALRLWSWQMRHPEQNAEMSAADRRNYAARVAINEVKRNFTDFCPETEGLSAETEIAVAERVCGNTPTEFAGLVKTAWAEIEKLSVRRRALLLHSLELIFYLRKGGISATEIRGALELSPKDWESLKDELPLSDTAKPFLTRQPF